jgi:hypothetical protein
MKWGSFAYGSAIGAAGALALAIGSARLLKEMPDANLANFGPALFGLAVVGMVILVVVGALVTASVFLYRRRWKRAGFALAFGITLLGYYIAALLY